MKKFLLALIFCFSISVNVALAAGGTTHNYIAIQTRNVLPDGELKDLLTQYENDYLVGSNYPDSGYVKGANYGEITHWDPFIAAYINYLHEHYPNSKSTNPRLIAFLMGIATHRVSDEIWHWTFLYHVADHDFNSDWHAADDVTDLGLDIIIAVDKNMRGLTLSWDVPVDDLLGVYQLLGHPVTKNEIIAANMVYGAALHAERAGAPLAYWYYKNYKLKWSSEHYEDDNISGSVADIKRKTADFLLQTYEKI